MSSIRRWLAADVARVRVLEHEVAVKRVHLTTLLAAALVALLVGFTGGLFTGHYVWRPSAQQIRRSCPPGNAPLGCVVRLYAAHNHVRVNDPSGPHFPDVSDWQGHPDWAAAKGSISGAVVKAYEYAPDPDFSYNAAALSRLGVRWGAYLFVRGCGYGPAFANTVAPWAARLSVLVLDMEVPAAKGCAPTLYRTVHAALPRVPVVIYSGPGTWPGGSNARLDVWVAAYGPSHPPCLFTCHVGASSAQTILAWQLTDGRYGFRMYVPGIGYGDVSLDYGMFPAPAKIALPVCIHRRESRAACAVARARIAKWTRALDASLTAFIHLRCQYVSAAEYRRLSCGVFWQRTLWFGDRVWRAEQTN